MTTSNATVEEELPQGSNNESEIVEPLADEGLKTNLKHITLNLKEFSEQHSKLILICPIMIGILETIDRTLLDESEKELINSALLSYSTVKKYENSFNDMSTKIGNLESSETVDELTEILNIIYRQFQDNNSHFANLLLDCAFICEITSDLNSIFARKKITDQLSRSNLPAAPHFLIRASNIDSLVPIQTFEIEQLTVIPLQFCTRFKLFADQWVALMKNNQDLAKMATSISRKCGIFLEHINSVLPENTFNSKDQDSNKSIAIFIRIFFGITENSALRRSKNRLELVRSLERTFNVSDQLYPSKGEKNGKCSKASVGQSEPVNTLPPEDSTPETSPLSSSSSSHSSEDDIRTSEHSSEDTQNSSPSSTLPEKCSQSSSLDNTDDSSRGLSSDKINSGVDLDIADLNKKINDLKKGLENRYNALEEAQLNVLMYLKPYIKHSSNENRSFINQVANTCIHYTPEKAVETQKALQHYCQQMSNRRKTDRCYLRGLGMGLMVFSCGIAIGLIAGALIAPGGISLLATATLAIGAIAGMSISSVSAATTVSSVALLSATLGSFLFFSKNKPETLTKKINLLDSKIENFNTSTQSESPTN